MMVQITSIRDHKVFPLDGYMYVFDATQPTHFGDAKIKVHANLG